MFLSHAEEQTRFDLDGNYSAGLPYEDTEGDNRGLFLLKDVKCQIVL